MDDSDSSSLSSAPPTDDEKIAPIFLKAKSKKTIKKKKKAAPPPSPPSPPRPKRSPSPEHEETLADNPDIAFIVMFRSRFSHAFPAKLPHYGPQDIEQGIAESPLSPQIEDLLCALLGLVLNRKKPVERGHFGRAMEEAISTQKHQWPRSWNRTNPLPGSKTFIDLAPADRLDVLRTLVMWSLSSSDVISQTIKEAYKGARRDDDLNQALSVQTWGSDGDKRRYFLIEGQEDTCFRLYREANRYSPNIKWWSVAATIDEVRQLAEKLDTKDTTQAARRLAGRINSAIPRFEQAEEKRRRREYRQQRKAQFTRPEPGFSLYEGRTRGKRIRYTFSDNEDESDATASRRSARYSGQSTPADSGPVVTASGRQVRPTRGGPYGESLLSGQVNETDYDVSDTSGRATRASRRISPLQETRKRNCGALNDSSDEEDGVSSGNEWDGGDDNDDDDNDEDVDMADGDEDDDDMDLDQDTSPRSLIVKLKIGKNAQLFSPEEQPPPVDQPQQKQLEPESEKALETSTADKTPPSSDSKQLGLTATAPINTPESINNGHPPHNMYTEVGVEQTNGHS